MSTQRILCHAAHHFPGEADGVVFVHPLDDPLDQGAKRSVDKWLGHAHHIDVVLFQEWFVHNGFLLIPGKTGEFPHEDRIDRVLFGLRQRNHLLKCRTFVCFPSGDSVILKNIFHGDIGVVVFCIIHQQTKLRIRGKFFLLVGGYTDVDGAGFAFR